MILLTNYVNYYMNLNQGFVHNDFKTLNIMCDE